MWVVDKKQVTDKINVGLMFDMMLHSLIRALKCMNTSIRKMC